MLLDITNNFSRNVNMDPETGNEPCVTYLFIDPNQIFDGCLTVRMENFELNIEDFIDQIRKSNQTGVFADEKQCGDTPFFFFNKPVALTFTDIKGIEICVIDEHKSKTFYSSDFRIKRGDRHFRICGESQFENHFIILDLIGNADAEVLLDFSTSDYVYRDIELDGRLLNGSFFLAQYHLQRKQSGFFEGFISQYHQIETTRFNFEFIKEYFEFKDIATKDED